MSARGVAEGDALCERAKQRLGYALSRFGPGVERVSVRFTSEDNALGGRDVRCRARVWLKSREIVEVDTLDGGNAIDRAADRLVSRIEWLLADGDGRGAREP